MSEKKIIVIAGNRQQFRDWVHRNIVPITHKSEIDKIRGRMIKDIVYHGTYEDWYDGVCDQEIRIRKEWSDRK